MLYGAPGSELGEASTDFQRVCLGAVAGLTLILGVTWVLSEPSARANRLLLPAVIGLLFSEWLLLGLLLRPRGTGLRRSLGARLVAFACGVSHLAFGTLQAMSPLVPGNSPRYTIRVTIGLWVVGALIVGAAVQAHRAAAGRPGSPDRESDAPRP